MQLFYNPNASEDQKNVLFDKEESGHITKVLRKKEGDLLHVTNGLGYLFTLKIINANSNKCVGEIIESIKTEPKNYKLHLAVAPTKMNERYEWFLEKATEIGVDEITPIICEHSERKIIKTDRFEKVIVSAMKQSLQTFKPILNEPIHLTDFLNQKFEGFKGIAHCEESGKNTIKEVLKPNSTALLLIGPEGDFSTSEIKKALENNFTPISLGNTRLRTETAAIVACHSVAFVNL